MVETKRASHHHSRTLSLYLFPIFEGDPNILRAVNRHKIHQRVPCLRLELCQQGVSLGKVSQELLNGGPADSLVVHLGADGIMLGFGIVKPFDEGIIAALEIRLVNGNTSVFVDGIPYHAGKPFVLVVCQDTAHAEKALEIVRSEDFFGGKYRDKVIKIDSKQKKAERDANTKLLLDVERAENPVEIVIHVNVLKEGWDVNNLYTIIPLRTASSKILREQMVGRGLRLPYGARTGDREIDAVTLTAHDKFDELIAEAQKGDSIFRAGNIIEAEDIDKEKTENTQLRLGFESDEDAAVRRDCEQMGITPTEAKKNFIKEFKKRAKQKAVAATQPGGEKKAAAEIAAECREELTRDEAFAEAYTSDQEAFDKFMGSEATRIHTEVVNKYIPIPRLKMTETEPPEYGFADFSLDVSSLRHQPADTKAYAQNLTDARETFILQDAGNFEPTEEPDRLIIRRLRKRPEADYMKNAVLLWKLVREAFAHYEGQYGKKGANRGIIRMCG